MGEPAVPRLQVPAALPEPAGPGLAPPGPPRHLLATPLPPLASLAPLGLVTTVPKVALALGLPRAVEAVTAGLGAPSWRLGPCALPSCVS